MPLVNTKKMFIKAYEEGYAIGCFNVDSIAMIQAVLETAEEKRSPVMVAFSEGSREFMHPGNIKDLIIVAAKDITIPFAIHLDHGKSVEVCKSCIDEGFTSVMIDASEHPLEENIRITKQVCEYAHARGVSVEGELGAISGDEEEPQSQIGLNQYTNVEEVVRFVNETGVDSLAVSVGTVHGMQKFAPGEIPSLRFDILEEIKNSLPGFPLVLHGASSVPEEIVNNFNRYGGQIVDAIGVPEQLLIKAAAINVCKINIGTDFRMSYVGGLRKALAEHPNRFEPRYFLAPAKEAAKNIVAYKLAYVFKSANRV
ncbi:MAG: ketose-bisphosphate aldolase [Bacilli bacterium]|jgi:fructose-bisphosphate aldolase class II|nr:ketose-bisphosphate aldolase [Bacilli bacterium]